MIIAAGGFFFFVLATSWIFGREFADGTVKDMLAVPVPRSSILSAKFITAFLWSLAITIAMTTVSLVMGAILGLPGASPAVISGGLGLILVTALLTIAAALTFALVASMGRGYLLSIGLAIMTVMMANLIAVTGRGEYFPWAVAGLYAHEPSSVTAVSFVLVVLTFTVAVLLTNWWWHKADQNK